MSQTVIGIFNNENEAQLAVENLVMQGFNREDVDIATNNSSETTTREETDDSFGSSISNFFGSLFGTDDDRTTRYSEVAKRGSTITVHARSESEAERAADILDEYGAVDIDEKANEYSNNFSNSDSIRSNTDTFESNDNTSHIIPVIEENLEVGKREVETGGARIRSRIVENPVEEQVRLRSEHINVERNPVNRQTTEAEFNTFADGTLEMTEHKEVPVVEKQTWVKEEISLNKEIEETQETIRDTVRSTEVDVENLNQDDDFDRKRNLRNEDNLDADDVSFNRDRDRSF